MPEVNYTDKSPVRLSELTKEIAGVINQHFSHRFYWVIAEITNHKFIAKNGYHYFDLSEKSESTNAQVTKIACTAFSTGAEAIRNFENYTHQKFSSNIEVLVKIKVDYSVEYGLRTILYDVDVAFTIGNLEKLKQQTLARLLRDEPRHIKLVGDELITTNKALSFPAAIKGIALITSRESEGHHDFRHTLIENAYGYKFHLFNFFSKVQAETAAAEIIESLKTIYSNYLGYVDAVVICRGGGAQTDFLTFNDYNLCRALARFPKPIITGIGHHSNQSLADLLVRMETKTPTKAAEFIVSHCHTFETNVLAFKNGISLSSQKIIAVKQASLGEVKSDVINHSRDRVAFGKEMINGTKNEILTSTRRMLNRHKDDAVQYHQSLVSNSFRIVANHRHDLVRVGSLLTSKPYSIVSIRKNNLTNEAGKLLSFSKKYLVNQQGYLNHHKTLFKHLNIENTLAKGFAIIRKNDVVIADPAEININDEISIQLKNTDITSKVTKKKDGSRFDL